MDKKLELTAIGCLQGKKLADFRENALKSFQDLSPRTLRRHRQPHYICVLKELEEDGYILAPQFIRDLMVENEEVILKDDLGITLKLSESPMFIDLLRNILTKAEERNRDRDAIGETKVLCSGALRFLDVALGRAPNAPSVSDIPGRGRGWLWLVRRLLLVALGLAMGIKMDGGEREANCRFLYARFLLGYYPDHDTETAAEHLLHARRMAFGIDKWKFCENDGDCANTLYSVICLLLRDMYLKKSVELGENDPQEAMRACQLAVKRAEEAENDDKYAEAVTAAGHCHILNRNFDEALRNFDEALEIRERTVNMYGICEALINVAIALQKLKKIDEAWEYLQRMLSLAEKYKLTTWEAHAFWRLGELMLRGGRPSEGSPLLFKAYNCFGGSIRKEKKVMTTIPRTSRAQRNKSMMAAMNVVGSAAIISPKIQYRELENKLLHNTEPVGFLVSSINRENDAYVADTRTTLLKKRDKVISDNQENLPNKPRKGPRESANYDAMEINAKRSSLFNMEVSFVSLGKKVKVKKKQQRFSSYFLDDFEDDDPSMTTHLDNRHKDELSHIRSMYGISRAQETIESYFDELSKSHTSMESRVKIINWKLNQTPFWHVPAPREKKPSAGVALQEEGFMVIENGVDIVDLTNDADVKDVVQEQNIEIIS